jgi:small multidrug resistance family-3 protein
MPEIARALMLFAAAGLAEIGGSWLMWQWLREGRPWPWGVAGAIVVVLYGVIPTLQTDPHFGRVCAAYGGVFIVLSLVWGRLFDGFQADRWDLLGALQRLAAVPMGLALAWLGYALWSERREHASDPVPDQGSPHLRHTGAE